ncbi:MAG: ABC transporter ATP-binding protein, partial [Capsulimonadales bacterium]|nr:ABC transporter ATP-binding protein [Capsulimonadales bacterium]
MPNAIEIRGLHKTFRVVERRFAGIKGQLGALLRGVRPETAVINALRDVHLDVAVGETLAVIGRNGSGKSTLLSLVANVMKPDSGTIAFPASQDPRHPKIAPLLEVGAGFHPDLTGERNVYFNGSILGITRAEMARRYDDIVAYADFAEPRYLQSEVRTYSSGMKVRLGFAVAVHTDPEIILMDETFAVGDEAFQEKCYRKIHEFQAERRTILLVSHDMQAVRRVATRAVWIDRGRISAEGEVERVIDAY